MWDVLGIAACDDPKAIRRAYAARLKELDPDRDVQAFARLREALERALAEAGRGAAASPRPRSLVVPDTLPDAAGALDAPVARTGNDRPPARDRPAARRSAAEDASGMAPERFDAEVADRVLRDELQSALGRRDGPAAINLYVRAAATGALSLQCAPRLLDRVFAVAIEDASLGPAAFREFAHAVGWDKPARESDLSDLRRRVLARLAAERWHASLLDAADGRGKATHKQAKLARLMLGRIGRYWMPRVNRAALRSRLDEYREHATWLRGDLDPAWVPGLERRVRRREIAMLVFYELFLAAILIDGAAVFSLEAAAGTLSIGLAALGLCFAVILIWVMNRLMTELRSLAKPSSGVSGS